MTARAITPRDFLDSLAEVFERPGYDSRLESHLLRGRTAGVKYDFQGALILAAEALGMELPIERSLANMEAARAAMARIGAAAGLPDPGKKAGWLAHDINRMKMKKPALRRIVAAARQAESESWFRD